MIVVRALQQQGRWRAGVHHPPVDVHHGGEAFTPEQLAAIEGDPLLDVRRIEEETDDGKAAGPRRRKGV